MMGLFKWFLGRRAYRNVAVSRSLLGRRFWLALFLLGWATSAQAVIPASERAVLLDIYASTNGASWFNNNNWNGGVGTECTWFGVSCDEAQSHVVSLDVSSNQLTGSIPSLSGLTALRSFSVGYNQLSGSIPSLSGLTALRAFYVEANELSGSIPSLSDLTVLQIFSVSGNRLTGSIPSLSGLTALRLFYASENQLTGSIPSLSGLTALEAFSVHRNQLTGSIPSLSGLTALRDFYAGYNQLSGSIPSLSGLTALRDFGVFVNQLTGSIPSLGGLTALLGFDVSDNQLTGSFPSLSGLAALVSIDVSNNQLTGSFPSLNGPAALRDFRVGYNQLSGSIPSLSGLTALQYFYVNNNQLAGPVPAAPTSLLPGECKLCYNNLVSSGSQATDTAWTKVAGNWLACQPGASDPPACTLTASPASISGGGTSTLTASCSPAATSYVWTGGTCAGTRQVRFCTVTPSASTTYTVAGVNGAGIGAAASATVTVAPGNFISPSACLFNWAERVYPNLFSPPGAVSQTLTPYFYRYYVETNAYLGTSSADNHLYYFGPASGNTLFDAGPLSYWLTIAGCP